jgi:hypothetical protein
MKNAKLILQYIKDNKTKEYKNMMELSRDFPDVQYFQLREIYLMSMGKTKRKLQKFNLQLYENIRIIDNPNYYKNVIQNEELPEVVAGTEC